METILCRLQSVAQTIDQIPLSPELVQCIKSKAAYIYERLSERSNKTTSQTFYDAILDVISEIEDLLFLPAVNHLLLRSKGNDGEKSNTSPEANSIEVMLKKRQELCPLQCARTDEPLTTEKTNSDSPVSEDERILCDIADDKYWEKRTKRVGEILGDTSMRFCKTLRVKREIQLQSPSSLELSNLDKEKNLAKDRSCSTRKISFKLPEKRREEKYDQKCIDKFWGISEDISGYEDERDKFRGISEDISEQEDERKFGDTICVVNCKSELKKLTDFLKTKGLRSFHIIQKPKGLAGSKGTWNTPPYVPPIEVKYGWPK